MKSIGRSFYVLQALRLSICLGLLSFVGRTMDLGTDLSWLGVAIIAGVALSGFLLVRKVSFAKVLLAHLILSVALYFGLELANYFVTGGSNPESDFIVYRYWDHFSILALAYAIAFISTWFFWTVENALTLESVLVSVVVVFLMGGHRNYHLDAPKKISDVAWNLGLAPQHVLLGLGGVFVALLVFYLYLGSTRPILSKRRPRIKQGKGSFIATLTASITAIVLLIAFGAFINRNYSADLSRATNGVGEQTTEGNSPLGFHSAIGETKQPAALVRLEGNYEDNPWKPMLYLREGALSSFSKKEFVVSPPNYDTDVPRISPGQPFVTSVTPNKETRKQLVHSVYLLTKHQAPFAIDYPQSIRIIKNPDPDRFTLAYQALSIAPIVSQQELLLFKVGNADWDNATWEHYLRAPGSHSAVNPLIDALNSQEPVLDKDGEDLRYRALAEKITAGAESPIQKAAVISEFLSQSSIYTRKPGHQITKDGDPVAPYLFSKEKRGYCVHFAHAAVYMMRLVGIPARIATGYLTDLSYAKDGHILLHLGDRHAWPEIYIDGIGWSVFDVTPQQAENEQAIVPDEKLLEELMGKIDPAEEFVPPSIDEDQRDSASDKIFAEVVNKTFLLSLLALGGALLLVFKLWCRFGYKLPLNPERKIRLAYLAFASLMADLGIFREEGETRLEFNQRLQREFAVDSSNLGKLLEATCYSSNTGSDISGALNTAVNDWQKTFRANRKVWREVLAFFSPLSFGRIGRW